MAVKESSRHPKARRRLWRSRNIDMSVNGRQYSTLLHPTNDIRLIEAWIVFTVDGDTADTANLEIGVQGALTRYANFEHSEVAAANQAGDTQKITLTNLGTLLPAGTALLVGRTLGAEANTAELQVNLVYEVLDAF